MDKIPTYFLLYNMLDPTAHGSRLDISGFSIYTSLYGQSKCMHNPFLMTPQVQ